MESLDKIELHRTEGSFYAAYVVGTGGSRIELPLVSVDLGLSAHNNGLTSLATMSRYVVLIED